MSGDDKPDALGRRQPSKYLRRKRATKAAQHRWKHKWQLLPGIPLQWGQRSLADQERHLAAAKKGGEATGGPIREQQRVFWRWYYGDCKEQLQGPFRTVVETLERIEAAYAQRYGWKGRMSLRWDGFMHYVFSSYVLVGCRKMRPETIERDMWRRYQALMDANDKALYGEGSSPGLLS
jgi:hypothetical protein